MPRVFIPVQMRDLTGGAAEAIVEGATVRHVIAALDGVYPGLASRLVQGSAIAPGLAVSVDGAMTPAGLLAAVRPQSEVHFLRRLAAVSRPRAFFPDFLSQACFAAGAA